MNTFDYISNLEKQSRKLQSDSSNIDKSFYLDVIEKVVEGYGYDYFEKIITGKEAFLNCIGLRACGALAYLLSNERKPDWFDLWIKLMDASCNAIFEKPDNGENDLAVKEMMLALKLMKNKVDKEHYSKWYQMLKSIDPYITYKYHIKNIAEKKLAALSNITVYNLAGEYLRENEGMTDASDYFDGHFPWVLSRFDENGMFVDNDHSMLYDLTTRCRIAVMLWYGYNGRYAEELDCNLEKAGLMTLLMQSSAFQLPYGGRSNQYLFNEALAASLCEFEAGRHSNKGNTKLAGMFKRCAHMSALTLLRWVDTMHPPGHIKNFFPHDSNFGIDGYGTYHRYLITIANFIGYGYIFADDSIEEYTCPSEIGGYVFETSKDFHKVFANCCGNSIEIELAADPHYDSTGMGRYQKADIPIELGLAVPFTATNKYNLPERLTGRNISICTGWRALDNKIAYISDFKNKLKTSINIFEQSINKVVFSIEYSGFEMNGCKKVIEKFTLDNEGVFIESELIDAVSKEIYFTVPLLKENGKDTTDMKHSCKKDSDSSTGCFPINYVIVNIGDSCYKVSSDGKLEVEENLYGNRNGVYKLAMISKNDTGLAVRLNLFEHVQSINNLPGV